MIFQEIAPNIRYSQNRNFFKYNCNSLDQLLLPYEFHGSSMRGILFFSFASCEPLSQMHINLLPSFPSIFQEFFITLIILSFPPSYFLSV